jgi:hypothetical protein
MMLSYAAGHEGLRMLAATAYFLCSRPATFARSAATGLRQYHKFLAGSPISITKILFVALVTAQISCEGKRSRCLDMER